MRAAVWPKTRSALPPEYQAIYDQHMALNRGGGSRLNSLALKAEEWMHRQVARPSASRVLELGAGGLNHVRFEPTAEIYDVIEPLPEVVSRARSRVPHEVHYLGDYDALTQYARQGEAKYDKVISVAVLEHLEDLPAVIAASAILLSPHGVFAAGIPSEGGRLWQWSWRLTTGRAFRRRFGLDYAVLMAWEHINSAEQILEVVNDLFDQVKVRRFPGPTVNTSVYTSLHAQGPNIPRAREILSASR